MIFDSTKKIQENLKKLELGIIDENNEENKNGVVLKIPSGEITNNFLLNNLGPKIPVKLKILGNMNTNVWLAHYTSQTDYQGKYNVWQICDDGKVSGINGTVDLNIRYKK